MKYLIFLMGFIFSFFSGSAQTHDYTNAACRYFKCPPGQHCAIEEGRPGCPACRKDFDDEVKAVAEESKRKADEKAAQELVEKQKRDEEFKKIAEQRKADENNKISIVSPNSGKQKIITAEPPPIVKHGKSKLIKTQMLAADASNFDFWKIFNPDLWGIVFYSNHFLDKNLDTILVSDQFSATFGGSKNNPRNFPDNIGIVILKKRREEKKFGYTYHLPVADLIDIKGNRIFNDDNITIIFHLVDDYFLIGYGSGIFTSNSSSYSNVCNVVIADEFHIYNLKTKKDYKLLPSDNRNWAGTTISTCFLYDKNKMPFINPWNTPFNYKPADSYKAFVVQDNHTATCRFYYIMNDGNIEAVENK